MVIGVTMSTAYQNVSVVQHGNKTYSNEVFSGVDSDLRSKFGAIHREFSPSPRKFYAFCTSVTVCKSFSVSPVDTWLYFRSGHGDNCRDPCEWFVSLI